MFDATVRVLVTMWVQRWKALREDEGATAVEYAVILAVAFAVATTVGIIITRIVTNHAGALK